MKKLLVTLVSAVCVLLLVAGTLIVLACSPLSAAIPGLQGTTPMVVLSGSMEPAMRVGGIVFVRPVDAATVRPGDIITFSTPRQATPGAGTEALTTHRVISVDKGSEGLAFQTKGDANNTLDQWTVPARSVRGVAAFSLPLLGYVSTFVRTRLGFALWVLIPALLLVGAELLDVVREIRRQGVTGTLVALDPGAEDAGLEVPA
jgi:signal peptidase